MTKYDIAKAVADINDKYIVEAINSTPKKNNKNIVFKILMVAASVAIVIGIIGMIDGFMTMIKPSNNHRPNGDNKYNMVDTMQEAVDRFGDDMLLDGFVLYEQYDKYQQNYRLIYKNDNMSDKSNWKALDCYVYYGDEKIHDEAKEKVDLTIVFDNQLYEKYENEYFNEYISTSSININGISVTYQENEYTKEEHGIDKKINSASFDYEGKRYYFSSQDKKLLIDTIESMLSPIE